MKYPRRNDGGFDAVPATERTRRGLHGALPAPMALALCQWTDTPAACGLETDVWRGTPNDLVRECFYPRERFTVERPNILELSVCYRTSVVYHLDRQLVKGIDSAYGKETNNDAVYPAGLGGDHSHQGIVRLRL